MQIFSGIYLHFQVHILVVLKDSPKSKKKEKKGSVTYFSTSLPSPFFLPPPSFPLCLHILGFCSVECRVEKGSGFRNVGLKSKSGRGKAGRNY